MRPVAIAAAAAAAVVVVVVVVVFAVAVAVAAAVAVAVAAAVAVALFTQAGISNTCLSYTSSRRLRRRLGGPSSGCGQRGRFGKPNSSRS